MAEPAPSEDLAVLLIGIVPWVRPGASILLVAALGTVAISALQLADLADRLVGGLSPTDSAAARRPTAAHGNNCLLGPNHSDLPSRGSVTPSAPSVGAGLRPVTTDSEHGWHSHPPRNEMSQSPPSASDRPQPSQ
jgi:hypothetical protein